MLKFSVGYTKTNPNFVIQNIKNVDGVNNPIFAILSNILQRGCPTIPSKFLQKNFGEIKERTNFKYNYNFSNCCWDYVIKGGNVSNPALNFYQNILPLILGKNSKTFIAECPLIDIIEDYTENKNITNSVDFYSPLYNAVIEIDGSQHQTNSEQNIKDTNRDELLKRYNVEIIRLNTNQLEDLTLIKEKLSVLKINWDYRNATRYTYPLTDIDKNYLLATRIEMLLLSLYENGYIKLNDKTIELNVYSNDNLTKQSIEISVKNFLHWLENICILQNTTFNLPEININLVDSEQALSTMSGINVSISLVDVYSQTNFDNVVYIKNDFFLYENNLISEQTQFNAPSTYLFKKNYFIVKSHRINYNLTKEKYSNALEFILKNVSNIYNEFRANQLDIILECLNNRSVMGILPTGAGKSLCYQLVSLLLPTKTIMIAPLQLLMVDQYNNIQDKLGITNVTYINSTKSENLNVFNKEKSLITIISPERFFSEKFTKSLHDMSSKVGFIVIDEAHCLSEWGHDFRTSYLCLSHNIGRFLPSETFLMALTGTASHRVFEDIDCEFQNFKKKKTKAIFADNMRRDNLTIFIQKTNEKYKKLIDNISPTLLGINKDKTLIFTKKKRANSDNTTDSACITLTETIKNDELLFDKINEDIISYYAGGNELTSHTKEQTLLDFKEGKLLVVVATKAFGMGVDVPDIRKTIHYGLPSSFESLYQQFGRAGRDGKPSECYVYYEPENPLVIDRYFTLPPISIKEMENNLECLNELQTNFYFIQSANLDIDIEEKVVQRLLEGIKTRNNLKADFVDCYTIVNTLTKNIKDSHLLNVLWTKKRINKDNEWVTEISISPSANILIEKALYRLFLLGEIEMWTLVYDSNISNPVFNHLKRTSLSEEEKLERLKIHIEKYETTFNFNQENTFENRLRFLIEWANENYLQERIQTMKTLYEQCELFTNSTDFMTYIANYFSNDPIYVRLVDRNIKLSCWIEALKTHPEKTRARIARLLESYDKIVPLNYVSGITRLRLNDFDNMDGKRRLELALESIAKHPASDRDYLFDNTYKLLNQTQKELFIECWINYINEDSIKIYEKTNSQVCENYLIINFANELIKIGEKLDDKLQ